MSTRGSNGARPPQAPEQDEGSPDTPVSRVDPVIAAMADARRRLAVVEHERRQAIYDARTAHGERPSAPLVVVPPAGRLPTGTDPPPELPPARGSLPTLDDLADSGKAGRVARWKLALAAVAGLASLAELTRQIVGLVTH